MRNFSKDERCVVACFGGRLWQRNDSTEKCPRMSHSSNNEALPCETLFSKYKIGIKNFQYGVGDLCSHAQMMWAETNLVKHYFHVTVSLAYLHSFLETLCSWYLSAQGIRFLRLALATRHKQPEWKCTRSRSGLCLALILEVAFACHQHDVEIVERSGYCEIIRRYDVWAMR